jgi:hypothetical protein
MTNFEDSYDQDGELYFVDSFSDEEEFIINDDEVDPDIEDIVKLHNECIDDDVIIDCDEDSEFDQSEYEEDSSPQNSQEDYENL